MEYAYQKTKNFERLSFLYLITGNLEKLEKMLKIAEMRNDIMGRFHNALYLGDVQERVRILEESNHLPLAFATAKVHGLTEAADDLEAKLLGENKSVPALPEEDRSVLLMPPRPILQENNWPLLVVTKGLFEGAFVEPVGAADVEDDEVAAGAWGTEMEIVEPEEGLNGEPVIVVDEEDRGEHNLELDFLFVVWVYINVQDIGNFSLIFLFIFQVMMRKEAGKWRTWKFQLMRMFQRWYTRQLSLLLLLSAFRNVKTGSRILLWQENMQLLVLSIQL